MLHFASEINIATVTLTENVGVIFYANNFYHSNADGNFKIRKDESL